jgi:lipopolysaccharide transport system ATP-binding protein
MSNDIAIRVENLSKRYRIGASHKQANTLRETLGNLAASPFDYLRSTLRGPSEDEIIWALKDVSFEVKQGEVVGIIGRNGAGTSTLLKILSRITEPTEGWANIHGRVGSLLEVGTGFHPELTGRENIYLNGAILGMTKAEIDRKFDEIVAFAEIEKFMDTPVKRYSSGMYVRLAFAVAAHLEPEILLVDEVLAVGDAAFQKKCLGKMGDVAREGRTVLFVSHNMLAIRGLTKRCLLLDEGRIRCEGDVNMVVEHYLTQGMGEMPNEIDTSNWDRPEGLGTDLKVTRVCLHSSEGQARVLAGAPLVAEMEIEVKQPVEDAVYGFSVFSSEGIRLFMCTNAKDMGQPYSRLEPGRYRIRGTVDRTPLPPGRYRLDIGVRCDRKGLDWLRDLMLFEVVESDVGSPWFKGQDGLFCQPSRWELPEPVL